MAQLTKILDPNNDGLYLICVDGEPFGKPMTEEAANAKIEYLNRPRDDASDELTP